MGHKLVIKQCCCGLTLRAGSLILGWLQVVGGVTRFIGLIFIIIALSPEDASDCVDQKTEPVQTSETDVNSSVILLPDAEFEVSLRRVVGLAYIELINIFISFVAGLLILIGAYKENHKVFWAAVYIEIVITFWNLAFIISYGFSLLWQEIIIGLINISIYLYFVIVLRSYGYEVKKVNEVKDGSEESLSSSSANEEA